MTVIAVYFRMKGVAYTSQGGKLRFTSQAHLRAKSCCDDRAIATPAGLSAAMGERFSGPKFPGGRHRSSYRARYILFL